MQRDHVRRRSRWYGAAFSPLSLFFGGANGAWYDPSDFSTMFQDGAGTVPVTAVGQPVGRLLDKSGRGNHAYNPSGNSANFPVLQQDGTGRYYLLFNGVNQWLQSINSIDFTYGDKMFVSAGVRKLSDASVGVVAELSVSAGGGTSGTFVLHGQTSPVGYRYAAGSGASGAAFATDDASVFTAPITNVVSGISDFAGVTIADEIIVRVNGAAPTQTRAGTVSTGNYGNYPLYIGARGGSSLWFNGRLYGLVVAGKQASASEIASTEAWLNQKTGAY